MSFFHDPVSDTIEQVLASRIRLLQPGDTWEYAITSVSESGVSRGVCVSRLEVSLVDDYYGHACSMLSDVIKFDGKDIATIFYISQEASGTIYVHGVFDPVTGAKWVVEPVAGRHTLIKSPIVADEQSIMNVCYDDGSRMMWSVSAQSPEDIHVPAGRFSAFPVDIAIFDEESSMNMKLWIAPEVGWPVKIIFSDGKTTRVRELTSMSRLVRVLPADDF